MGETSWAIKKQIYEDEGQENWCWTNTKEPVSKTI